MKRIFIIILLCIVAIGSNATSFTIATYNIRNANKEDSLVSRKRMGTKISLHCPIDTVPWI